jgi:hypothetical protein
MSITLREAKHSLKAEDEQYCQLKLKAPMMQQDFLRERMRDNTLMEKTRSHAKQCLRHEQSRDNAQRMKHMQGKRPAGAVSKVGTGQGDDYQEYEDQATVERLIMANNAACFHLTEDTPPMTEPLLSDLGYLADTEAVAQILDGTYICPPGTDDYTRDFL